MLVTMKEILVKAREEGYGVPAPNFFDYPSVDAIIRVAEEQNSPMIMDFSIHGLDLKYANELAEYAGRKAAEAKVPLAINLDHGALYEEIVIALANKGFTSVMVDRSSKPFEENVKETAEIVKIAHALGKSVEAELGHVGRNVDAEGGGTEEAKTIETDEERRKYMTKVDEAVEFVKQTDVDCLAVAIGTVHGLYPKDFQPKLDFELLAELKKAVPVPLVVHGGSGTGDENIARACREGITKVNLFSDLMKAGRVKAATLEVIEEEKYDKMATPVPAFYKGYRECLTHYVEILGSKGKA